MLRLLGSPRRCCDGLTRRETLRAGALGLLGGLSLPQLLAAEAAAGHRPGKARSVILLYLLGGAATQDMWDLKPGAPSEVRGEFKPIPTRVPGLQICEHLPRLAAHADQLAVIRSMTHNDVDHTTSTHYLLTGRGVPRRGAPLADDWPSYGAVLARLGRGRGSGSA